MKLSILLCLSFLISFSALAKKSPTDSVKVLSAKRDILYLKVQENLIGGNIEVYSNGELMYSGKIYAHRVIIDFYSQCPGTFDVKFKKEDVAQSFVYEKTSDNHKHEQLVTPDFANPTTSITVYQHTW